MFRNALSFGSVLTGISKVLNIINQTIPLYNQVKPTVSKAKGILDTVKTLSINNKKEESKAKIVHKKTDNYNSLPVFFS